MDGVSAEQLIALEAAVAELGGLYATASGFTALQEPAETRLLPRLTALGRQLRHLVRSAQLTAGEVERAAAEIQSVRSEWRSQLERLRDSPLYQQARTALTDDRQEALAHLIPQVLAGLRLLPSSPDLYFPVSPSSGQRRPGSSPFLSAGECANRLVAMLNDGMAPADSGPEWWERDWPSISCADTPAALESPIALCLRATDVRVAVFSVVDEAALRIFTPLVHGPFSITLANEATDQWWEAYEDSFAAFRDALQREITARGYAVTTADVRAPFDSGPRAPKLSSLLSKRG